MPGMDFLIFYVVIAVLTLFATHLALELMDPTTDLDRPHVPSQPDPYKFAYLRGGDNELARLAILDLVDKGYLVIEEKKRFLQSSQQLLVQRFEPRTETLTPFQ